MNEVRNLLFYNQTFRSDREGWRESVCTSFLWSLSIRLPLKNWHACGSTRTHGELTYAGSVTAERECGILRGFGAGGCQLFALFIFDLTWPQRAWRLLDHTSGCSFKGSNLSRGTESHSCTGRHLLVHSNSQAPWMMGAWWLSYRNSCRPKWCQFRTICSQFWAVVTA